MYKTLIVLMTVTFFSFKYTDLASENIFYSVILPLADVFLLIILGLCFVLKFPEANKPTSNSDGGTSM